MNKIILFLLVIFPAISLQSQVVGINTITPTANLHVVGSQYNEGSALLKIGGNSTMSESAQLELADINRGFMPNVVALTALQVKAPVVDAVDGMVVYNTAATLFLFPGYYIWMDGQWRPLLSGLPGNPVSSFTLLESIYSAGTEPTTSENGNYMSIGDETATAGHNFFRIEREGAYAFAIRIYGDATTVTGKSAGRACVYFTLMINGVKKDVQEVNWALVGVTAAGVGPKIGGTVLLTASGLKEGDSVEFVLGHYDRTWSQPVRLTGAVGLVANKTSLVFWQL